MIADVDYSLIQGGEAEGIYFEGQNDPTLNWGDNNLTDNNVMFNDLTNGDYRLSNYSPAIGAGTSNGAPRFDLNGASRPSPSNSNPDMGAYENALGTQSHNEFIYVNTEGSDAGSVGLESSPFETIQSAIDYSLDGDTVLVYSGTYTENINYNGKNIVVGSLYLTTADTSYISSTIIDGNQNGSVLTINDTDDKAEFVGFTLKNGSSIGGGGIKTSGTTGSKIKNTIIKNNTAGMGAGIYGGGSPIFENVSILSNVATGNYGSGVYFTDGSPVFKNSKISNNTGADNGGGGAFISSLPGIYKRLNKQ